MKKELLELRTSEFFKCLSDYSRFKIIVCLLDGELCVSDIVNKVDMTQTAVSYQLKLLRANHLVKYRRDGQNIYYSVDDNHIKQIIDIAYMHLTEDNDEEDL